ncbi:hypothetical protein INT47_006326 [Mucor saturninus]|uniref:NADPH--hemoprotein reductase n=1 Tax=Mucor saturninus TaxID=64648 RepID=A0A8H7VA61_9FUNG|nr:hypothetical protein INT47_006326 [Mucor saturninus]
MATRTTLIAVLQNSANYEEDGVTIHFSTGTSIQTFRSMISKNLGVFVPLDDILMYSAENVLLKDMEEIQKQQVIYISVIGGIKTTIPGPRKLPLIGSLYELLPDIVEGFQQQFKKHGNLVNAGIFSETIYGCNDPATAAAFVKESEFFTKNVGGNLVEVKAFTGNGLFTSDTKDMEWQLAHKLLMPAFSTRAIKAYQVEMGLITQEAVALLEQFLPDEQVELLEWTTNITFETIGKIGFGFDFNLLKDKNAAPHPFISAMVYCFKAIFIRFKQPGFMKHLPLEQNRKFDREVKLMHDTVEKVIAERKNSPDAKNSEKDLLGFMLNAHDEHNLGLTDENIRDQVMTFLIAGHETTSATLAFSLYELSQNKEIQQKVLQEIANAGITHDKLPTSEQIGQLKYMRMFLREILRLYTPVGTLTRYCIKDCILPGGYFMKKGSTCQVNSRSLHWNEETYPDPFKCDPERWTPEEEQKRSRFSWLPFSNGVRSCIGMAFAYQEALTVLSMLLQRFDFVYEGPPIHRDINSPTTRPFGFFANIHPRTNMPEPTNSGDSVSNDKPASVSTPVADMIPKFSNEKNMLVELPSITFLYGTQTGTCQDYANQLSNQAKSFGFKDITLCQIDEWKVLREGQYNGPSDRLSSRELVIICTATYNGMPPDSAENFDLFLDTCIVQGDTQSLNGLLYTVFGCGNRHWTTYQSFPKHIDTTLEELGAERFFVAGQGDAADGDMDLQFQEWATHFWVRCLQYFSLATSGPTNPIISSMPVFNGTDINVKLNLVGDNDIEKLTFANRNKYTTSNATILARRELHNKTNSDRSTSHIEIDVSQVSGLSPLYLYQPGDHLEIIPANSADLVKEFASGFGLDLDLVFEIDSEYLEKMSSRSIARTIKGPCTIENALTYYADLLSPPSRSMLGIFATQLQKLSPETAAAFEKLTVPMTDSEDQYPAFIARYRTLLDLQLGFPQINQLELGQLLAALTVIQPRRYSVASSPSVKHDTVSIAVGLVKDSINGKVYPGLTSTYLSTLDINSRITASFKSSKNTFSLPQNAKIPLILIAAGTGLAPFMGFLQERSLNHEAAPCTVFFGCRHPEQDYIYKEELEEFVDKKVISNLNLVYSRYNPEEPQKYVQHAISNQAADIWKLLTGNETDLPASVYVCGAGNMSRDVRKVFEKMAQDFGAANSKEASQDYISELVAKRRYNEDTWA